MKRGKKMVLVSHCILNANAKVEGLSTYPAAIKELIEFFMDNGIGIMQLPCPEMEVYGIKRWGHVKEQFDTPYFREACRNMLRSTARQVEDYIRNGYEMVGLVGIDGSPSCGIEKTCSSRKWGGETDDKDELWDRIEDASMVDGRGVFMEELISLLGESKIALRLFSICETGFEASVAELMEELTNSYR